MPVEPASSDTTGPCCGQRGIYYLSPGGAQPEIFHQCGEGALARRLQSGMKARGFEVAVNGPRDSGLKLLAESMMQLVPQEVIELRLNTGMTSEHYRTIGHCLKVLRNQGVLHICLDRLDADGNNASHSQPHDGYIRHLIRQWEDEQKWVKAMSKSGLNGSRPSPGQSNPVADPTLCTQHRLQPGRHESAPTPVWLFAE